MTMIMIKTMMIKLVNVKDDDDDDNASHQEVHAAVRKWLAEKAGPTVAAETRWR